MILGIAWVRSDIISIFLFPANVLLHGHPNSSTQGAWCRRLHTLSGNCNGFCVHFSKIVADDVLQEKHGQWHQRCLV